MNKNEAIVVRDIWKSYLSGGIGSGTLVGDIRSLAKKLKGKELSFPGVIEKKSLTAADAKRNKRFWALKNISFSIQKSDVVAILGRNGAGKSTLLRIISQVTEADRGEIAFRGRMTSLLGAGIGFNPEMTGRENIFLNGSILGLTPSEIKARMDEIISFSEIPNFIDTPLKRYSDGMRARLGFSVAISLNPEILVLDEVFMTGDRMFRAKCIERVKSISEMGTTILVVTHFPEIIKDICQRGITLGNGEILFDGDIGKAIEIYSSC